MLLSNSCKYGVRALLYIAMEGDKNKKTGLQKIAEALDIPSPYLSKIMRDLGKYRLVRSSKGPNGGFYMTPKEKSKTLLDIIEAVDGLKYFTECSLGMEDCNNSNPCPLHKEIVSIRENIKKTIGKHSIEKVAQKVKIGELVITLK